VTDDKPKRKKPVTLGHRSMEWLEEQGYLSGIVERKQLLPDRRPGARPGSMIPITWDLFGFADLVAVSNKGDGPLGTTYIQVTDRSNAGARVQKLLLNDKVEKVLGAGNRVWVMAWGKVGPRGGRKLWKPRIIHFLLGKDGFVGTEEQPEEETSVLQLDFHDVEA